MLAEEVALKNFIEYLGRYYLSTDVPRALYDDADGKALPIWTLWLQGEEQAPPLVRRCIASMRKHAEGRRVECLSYDTLEDHGVQLPDCVHEKFAKGIIGPEHFSDLVRLCLLERHGGTWLDATILTTGPVPEFITDEHFFAYRAGTENIYAAHTLFSTWLMHASPNHIFIRNLKNAMLRYWECEETSLHYFVFHFMFYGMVHANPAFTRLWTLCSQLSNQACLALYNRYGEAFDPIWWAKLRESTPFHRMSSEADANPPAGSFGDIVLHNEDALDL